MLSDSIIYDLDEIKALEKTPIKWVLKASALCKLMDQSDMTLDAFNAYEYLSHYNISTARITGVTSAAGKAQHIYKESIANFKAYKTGILVPGESRESVINRTCCIIAETPEELGADPELVYAWVRKKIGVAIAQGYKVFVVGCDIGSGCVAAETVLAARTEMPEIKLISAEPELPRERNKGLDFSWNKRISNVINQADCRRYIACREYEPNGLFERNKWVVDHSSNIIVIHSGGLNDIVHYAQESGKSILCYGSLDQEER